MILERLMRRFQNSTLQTPAEWLADVFGGPSSVSGQSVTSKSALGISAYFASIRNISEDCGKLPVNLYERMDPRGKTLRRDHPVYPLLHDAPNGEMSAMTFRETLTSHALGWKGGFAEIVRRGDGKPSALWPLDPNTVTVMRYADGSKFYRVQVQGQDYVDLQESQVFDLHGLGYDAVTGYAMANIARESIGSALGAQSFGAAYFGNGAVSTGYLKVPGVMKDEALKRLRESFAARHQGARNAHKPIILENGVEWVASSNDPQKSQMIETLEHDIEEIARWFRMPPHKIGHLKRASGWSTLEATNQDYLTDTLLPWFVRWEHEIHRKLLGPSEKSWLFAKFDTKSMLRTDAQARATYYKTMFDVGAMSQNDIRDEEDMNGIGEDGDVYFVSTNVQPTDQASAPPVTPQTTPEPEGDIPPDGAKPGTAETGEDGNTGNHPTPAREYPQDCIADIAGQTLVFADALATIFARNLKVESDRVRSMSRRPGFNDWADEFFNSTPDRARQEIATAFQAFSASIWSVLTEKPQDSRLFGKVSEHAAAAIGRHNSRSRAECATPSTVDHWTDGTRAREQANAEAAALVALIQLQSRTP